MKKVAVFPGTFDPFTIGHRSLISRGLTIVDEIIVAIGINDAKKSYFSLENRIAMIQALYKSDSRVSVASYNGLTVDFARQAGADFIIRGIRSVNDFEYEKTIADMNRNISGIETLVLFTEPRYTHISSTIVRELLRFGHDVKDFIPDAVNIDSYR